MNKKKIKIGLENFKTYIEGDYYYVDKTDFIRELITDHKIVNLITRPRRFGKTFGLSMLRCFFEIDKSKENERLFTGLKIMEYPEYLNHLGKYPVIHLSFKGAKRLTLEHSIRHICTMISDEYFRHKEAVSSYEARLSQINAIRNYNEDISYYYDSIYLLSQILYDFHKVPVIILIDEYDVPLEHAFFNDYYAGMLDFIRALFESALKTNDVLEFAVLTGCLRISKDRYSKYFGFTEAEVWQIIQYYDLKDTLYEEIKDWYNGYHFGNEEIYNPWSVLQAVDSVIHDEPQYLEPYWSNTSSNLIVRSLLDHADANTKEEIEELLRGGFVQKPIMEDIAYDDINREDSLWTFLYNTGYLTSDDLEFKNGSYLANLKIPNREVKYIFENHIQKWIDKIIKDSKLEGLYKAILDGKADIIRDEINKVLLQTISYNDYRETFYHGLVLGLLSGMSDYVLKSNAESGHGRSDVVLKHASGGGTAVIFEFKLAENGTVMEKKSREALKQIEEMKYGTDLLHEGYEQIIKYGISFNKKRCFVSVANI